MSDCWQAVVWQGASQPPLKEDAFERKKAYMVRPVVHSVLVGLQHATNHRAHILSGGGLGTTLDRVTRQLSSGDIFIWVGLYRLSRQLEAGPHFADFQGDGMAVLRDLARRDVFTVYYSTDAADAAGTPYRMCALNNKLVVHEVWEYSHATIAFCNRSRHGLAHRTRYVPPSHVRSRGTWAFADAHTARAQLLFIGALTYPPRIACFNALNGGGGRRPHNHTGLVAHSNQVWSDASLHQMLRKHAFFVNLHKECDAPPNETNCETLRFAQLLAVGAVVLSERCDAQDEAEWSGLVHFVSRDEMPERFQHLWRQVRSGEILSGAALVESFQKRLNPRAVFERAGLIESLSRLGDKIALRARHQTSSARCLSQLNEQHWARCARSHLTHLTSGNLDCGCYEAGLTSGELEACIRRPESFLAFKQLAIE
ncbi:hypothetical protein AB1Y20_009057 [Prymnesium parvum]|uniref:Uncharacterized protein n=1 Tax=Prymnesium parvum TaxID=97485 RepID=A0AB34K3W5_PRYPA